MRTLIPALAAASVLMLSLPSYSADDVKSGGVSTKPARAIEESTVKAVPSDKPGRAIEDSAVKSAGASNKPGRAIEDSTVK